MSGGGLTSTSRPRGCSRGSRASARPAGAARAADAEGVLARGAARGGAAGRLTLLPVERAVAGDGARYTAREDRRDAGVDLELLRRFRSALGIPYADPDERLGDRGRPRGGTADEGAARRRLPRGRDAAVARTIGMGTARVAEANRELIDPQPDPPGDTERDVALRLPPPPRHAAAGGPDPRLRLQAQPARADPTRRDRLRRPRCRRVGGAVELTVCFADLVEFTRLGEEIAAEELGIVAGRLEEMATRRRRAAGAAGEDDRRRGDARLHRGRALVERRSH